jgi:hypothetical protein
LVNSLLTAQQAQFAKDKSGKGSSTASAAMAAVQSTLAQAATSKEAQYAATAGGVNLAEEASASQKTAGKAIALNQTGKLNCLQASLVAQQMLAKDGVQADLKVVTDPNDPKGPGHAVLQVGNQVFDPSQTLLNPKKSAKVSLLAGQKLVGTVSASQVQTEMLNGANAQLEASKLHITTAAFDPVNKPPNMPTGSGD